MVSWTCCAVVGSSADWVCEPFLYPEAVIDHPAGSPDNAFQIVVLCMGNICRSPMAEGLLRKRLDERKINAHVHSAGRLQSGRPADRHSIEVLAERGIDIRSHRSRTNSTQILEPANLVIAMAREHVRDAVTIHSPAWPRTFTLKELVRRGEANGKRPQEVSIETWLGNLHAGRERRDLLGESHMDDIEDPYGYSREVFEQLAGELDDLTARMINLMWPDSEITQ